MMNCEKTEHLKERMPIGEVKLTPSDVKLSVILLSSSIVLKYAFGWIIRLVVFSLLTAETVLAHQHVARQKIIAQCDYCEQYISRRFSIS